MDSLVVPDLDILRRWLEKLNLSFYECDSCQALHLPHMQNFDGIFDAKVDLVEDVILFSSIAEIQPTTFIALVGGFELDQCQFTDSESFHIYSRRQLT